jgi:hypothetical protein
MNKVNDAMRPVGSGRCAVVGSGDAVEARETQRTTEEVNERDHPAGAREVHEDNAVDHQRWGEAERNDVG